MKVVVAHDWLTNWAGSEQVAREMMRVSGATQMVASIVKPELAREHLPDIDVRALWPTQLPSAKTKWQRYALPMMASWAAAKIDADVLIVSSHFAAHAATLRFNGPSIVYYHTPARILWRSDLEHARLPPKLKSAGKLLGFPALRRWDRFIGAHPAVVLANSNAVARRINEAYGREARVLHPPVDVEHWASVAVQPPSYFLWVGRLVAYKRPDLAVEAARISGEPLVIAGDGPERSRLERNAPPNVRFVGYVPEAEKRSLMARAYALIFPGEEDFGIAPVEALAAGVPVLAYGAGGAQDYIRDGCNGLVFLRQDADALADRMRSSKRIRWSRQQIRQTAAPFSRTSFQKNFRAVLDSVAS